MNAQQHQDIDESVGDRTITATFSLGLPLAFDDNLLGVDTQEVVSPPYQDISKDGPTGAADGEVPTAGDWLCLGFVLIVVHSFHVCFCLWLC